MTADPAITFLRETLTAKARRAHWTDLALCAEVDPGLFFPEDVPGASPAHAKRVCALCPVRPQCLAYALDNDIRHGVYGGTSGHERRTMRRGRAA